MKTGFLIFVFAFLLSCGYTTVEDLGHPNNCHFRTNSGFVIKWRDLPIPVYTHISLSALTRKNFIYAVDMWNESWNYYTGEGALFEFMGDTDVHYNPQNRDDDGINILYMDKRHYFLAEDKQATTYSQNMFGGLMVEADIIFNGIHYKWFYEKEAFDYSAYTQVPALSTGRYLASTSPESFWQRFLSAWTNVLDFFALGRKTNRRAPSSEEVDIGKKETDFLSVGIHELGHHAGLGHINSQPSIMNAKLATGEVRRDIGELELSSLACGYKVQKAPGRSLASTERAKGVKGPSFWQRLWSRLSSFFR